MSNDIRKLIHRVYNIAISAVTVVAGARIAHACYKIYTNGKAGGGQIYSSAIVAEAFQGIAISVYLCLALVIGGFILHLLLPPEKKKPAIAVDRQHQLRRLQAKTNMTLCDPQLRAAMEKQQKSRRLHSIISAALLAVFSVIFLAYACDASIWPAPSHIIDAMVPAVAMLALCLIVPTGYTIFTAYFCRRSLDAEFQLAKEAAKQAPMPKAAETVVPKKHNIIMYVRYGIVALALVMMIVGYCAGGFEDVIAKAAALCQECVGIG